MKLLIYTAALLFGFLLARASFAETCVDAATIDEQISDLRAIIAEHTALAAQYCSEPAYWRECGKERLDLKAWRWELWRLINERNRLRRVCR